MSFVQWEYTFFFVTVLLVYWQLARRGQNLLLLAAGALFYGWVHPWFLLLLYGSTALDFVAGQRIEAGSRRWLGVSLVGNLGLLGAFKYYDFFARNVAELVGMQPLLLELMLPVGISFYTFQTMSYSLDVFRGRAKARMDWLDYAVYVGFFPQLVAGPIERAEALLPQVERERIWSWAAGASGLELALWGAFKKVCVADVIAPHVDRIFALQDAEPALVWAATLGFSVQILADFSGYTDIARGCARMLGFELSLNFDHPYLATSPRDLWRRWHITFSEWIRDYIYIPAGGSRHGGARTVLAIWTALVLSGLWHGAAWHFVLWGAYHAALVTIDRWAAPHVRLPRPLMVGLTFMATLVGWLIFRDPSLEHLVGVLTQVPWTLNPGSEAALALMLGMTAAVATPLLLALMFERAWSSRLESAEFLPVRTLAWAGLAVAVVTMTRPELVPFIYFRF